MQNAMTIAAGDFIHFDTRPPLNFLPPQPYGPSALRRAYHCAPAPSPTGPSPTGTATSGTTTPAPAPAPGPGTTVDLVPAGNGPPDPGLTATADPTTPGSAGPAGPSQDAEDWIFIAATEPAHWLALRDALSRARPNPPIRSVSKDRQTALTTPLPADPQTPPSHPGEPTERPSPPSDPPSPSDQMERGLGGEIADPPAPQSHPHTPAEPPASPLRSPLSTPRRATARRRDQPQIERG